MTVNRIPNDRGEFFLSVTPVSDHDIWTIYDVTRYLDSHNGIGRNKMLGRVNHTVKGHNNTVYIEDWHESLSDKQAFNLAKEWYLGNSTTFRLD